MKRLGDRGVVLARGTYDIQAIATARSRLPGCVDFVVTENEVAFFFEEPTNLDESTLFAAFTGTAPSAIEATRHTFRVRYDGADLEWVAATLGVSRERVIELHASAEYRVAFLGFMPGFAYLAGLPSELILPRRATPRVRVPAMSVAVGGPYAGVYPFGSSGGWHLLGTLLAPTLFDSELGPLLQHGDVLRFVEVP